MYYKGENVEYLENDKLFVSRIKQIFCNSNSEQKSILLENGDIIFPESIQATILDKISIKLPVSDNLQMNHIIFSKSSVENILDIYTLIMIGLKDKTLPEEMIQIANLAKSLYLYKKTVGAD